MTLKDRKAAMDTTGKIEVIAAERRGERRRSTSRLVEIVSPAPRAIWRELIDEDPDALVTQSPEWLDALCKSGEYQDASRLYLFEDGQRLLLPLARRPILFGVSSTLSSFPNSWGMGGALSSRPLHSHELGAVMEDLAGSSGVRFSIRPNPLKGDLWGSALPEKANSIARTAHVLELSDGFPLIWEKKFKSVTRTAIRKAEKSGLVVEKDTTGKLIQVFYQLFEQSLERWGSKQHEPLILAKLRGRLRDPLSKFEAIQSTLGEAFQVWVAWLNGEPVASILVLRGKNANYTRGAMNKELAGPVRANDLLHRMAIEDACSAGCRYYHMGETGQSASLASFKSNFGAQPVDYPEIYFEKLPITRTEEMVKGTIKKLIGFKDA